MDEYKKLYESFVAVGHAVADAANSLGEFMRAYAVKLLPTAKIIAAYEAAKKEHPEWIHRAAHSKKKRIRKKYHDRIMQEYGRC